ncbi:MAG: ABC transporter ATP-binding protein [Microvirga sp.]
MILEARSLRIGYRNRVVGADLDLGLGGASVVALLGPNGGGKTTLLKTLLGLIPPLGGQVLVDGRDIGGWTMRERARRLAYVPQIHGSTFGFSVEEVVMMGRTAHGSAFAAPSAKDREIVREAMAVLDLGRFGDRPFTEISGGERQLALVARALAQEPRAIILDEPTASLDFANQGAVLRTLRSLAGRGYGILFTTHDPNHALRHADLVVMIRDGRILCQGPADEIVTARSLAALYGRPVRELGRGRDRGYLPE